MTPKKLETQLPSVSKSVDIVNPIEVSILGNKWGYIKWKIV